jgi:uncharacterized protein (DUF433 family)
MSIQAGLIDIGSFIDQREGYRGGRPFVVGTGVTVDAIACRFAIDGLTPGELAMHFNLSLAQVMAALTFYEANRDAIESDLEAQEREAREAMALIHEKFGRLKL